MKNTNKNPTPTQQQPVVFPEPLRAKRITWFVTIGVLLVVTVGFVGWFATSAESSDWGVNLASGPDTPQKNSLVYSPPPAATDTAKSAPAPTFAPPRATPTIHAAPPVRETPRPANKPLVTTAQKAAPPAAAAAPPAVIPPRDSSQKTVPALEQGWLVVSTKPWGELMVDGRDIGATPQAGVMLAAGLHKIEIKRAGYKTYVSAVTIEPGRPLRLTRITLEVLPP